MGTVVQFQPRALQAVVSDEPSAELVCSTDIANTGKRMRKILRDLTTRVHEADIPLERKTTYLALLSELNDAMRLTMRAIDRM